LNPGGGEIFRTCPDQPWGPPSLLYNGYRVFPGGRKRPGRDADLSALLVPRSKNRVELYLRAFIAYKKGETYLYYIILYYYNTYHCVTVAYSIQYSNMLYRFVA
jgi:hypothetical protein